MIWIKAEDREMGKGYHFTCKSCGYSFGANLGVGFAYPVVYQETLQAARAGKLGKQVKDFLKKYPNGAINPTRVLARCRNCGCLEPVPELSMYAPVGGQEPKVHKGGWSVAFDDSNNEYVSDFTDGYELVERYDQRCDSCGGTMEIIPVSEFDRLICPECGSKLTPGACIMWD